MSEIFRDRTEGAIARRQDLLRRRRDEFVMMPHAIRRVVVARAARKAASIAMIASGVAMLAVAMSPSLATTIAAGLPGINPAVVSTFVGAAWVLGLVAFAISRGRSEHRFAVEMSKTVLPGQDLDQDIERLSHEHPDAVARRMAHRLEVSSAALPVAAAGFVLPATLVYVAHAIYARGWPSTAEYELNLVDVGPALLAGAVTGVFAAIVMTRRGARAPSMAGIAGAVAAIAGIIAATALKSRELSVTWPATVVAVLAGTIAFVDWRLIRERTAIEAEDPAAGSELFTLRGFIDACRRGVGGIRRHVTAPMALGAVAFGTLLVCAGGPLATGPSSAAATPAAPHANTVVAPDRVLPGASSYTVTPTGDGRLRVAITIVNGQAIEIPSLSGMSIIPPKWKARVVVRLETNELPADVAVTPFPADGKNLPLHFGASSTEHRFWTEACDGEQPIGLRVVADADFPKGWYTATFLVEPVLELSTCL